MPALRPYRAARLLTLALLLAVVGIVPSNTAHAASGGCATANGTVTCTFNVTNTAETWIVPAGVTAATFDLYGAQGAGLSFPSGGRGGQVTATLAVTPGVRTRSWSAAGVGMAAAIPASG